MTDTPWQDYAEACAFVGNSLLKPMTQTEPVGLDPAFWDAFPDFGSQRVSRALEGCKEAARSAQERLGRGEDAVEAVSVEYTRLFVGPPSPAAPPWETMNKNGGQTVGFGEPTFAMQRELGELGLQISNDNHQYADHLGIELLVLSELCSRVRAGERPPEKAAAFAREHPAAWTADLRAKVHEAFPGGYYDALLGLAEALAAELDDLLIDADDGNE